MSNAIQDVCLKCDLHSIKKLITLLTRLKINHFSALIIISIRDELLGKCL